MIGLFLMLRAAMVVSKKFMRSTVCGAPQTASSRVQYVWDIWAQFFWGLLLKRESMKLALRNSKQFSGESIAIPIQNFAAKAISLPQHWAKKIEWG